MIKVMDLFINERGRLFYQNRKKELYQYFYIAPIFIMIILVLFVLGAKSKLHLYFSFFLIFFLASLFIVAMLSIAKKLNRTISHINLNADGTIDFRSFKVFFFKSIVINAKKEELKFYSQQFLINKKEKEFGWIIRLKNDKQLYLYKSFFDSDIIKSITKIE